MAGEMNQGFQQVSHLTPRFSFCHNASIVDSARIDESFDINFQTSARDPKFQRGWNPKLSRNHLLKSPQTQQAPNIDLTEGFSSEYDELKDFINQDPSKTYHELLNKVIAQTESKLGSKTPKEVPPPEIQVFNKVEFRNKTAGEGTRKKLTPKVESTRSNDGSFFSLRNKEPVEQYFQEL